MGRGVRIIAERTECLQDAGLSLWLEVLEVPFGLTGPGEIPRGRAFSQGVSGGSAPELRPSVPGERSP